MKWASKTGGLVVKTDRDTFVYIFEQRYLKLLKEEKFSILDSIKEIELEGKLPVTLSIAISNEGTSNYEKYKSALSAMDIALGRGTVERCVVKMEILFLWRKSSRSRKKNQSKSKNCSTCS